MFEAFGCEVAFWTRTPRDLPGYAPLERVVAESDVLVVVIALSEETRELIDPRLMKAGSLLVNAARGGVVGQSSLLEALSGGLGGAALDVFETEPLSADDPLLSARNVLLSPHVAGVTGQATGRLIRAVVGNLTAVAEGLEPVDVVNGADLVVTRKFGGSPSA